MIRFSNKVDENGDPISVKILPEEESRFIESLVERALINSGFPEKLSERQDLLGFIKFWKKLAWPVTVAMVISFLTWLSTLLEVKLK